VTVHAPHPDTHTHGLADGCARCAEHAEHPFHSLDNRNLRGFLRHALLVREYKAVWRSDLDRKVGERLLEAYDYGDRLRQLV
jgi:hypothetical protein